MDKISKRSKGYAFIEYTTEEAASAALKEMNGKVSLHASSSWKIFLLCLMFKRGFVWLQLWFIIVYKSKITLRIRETVWSTFVSGTYRLLMAGWLLLMLPRVIHQDIAAATPYRNFDKRERTLIHCLQGQTKFQATALKGLEYFDKRERTLIHLNFLHWGPARAFFSSNFSFGEALAVHNSRWVFIH